MSKNNLPKGWTQTRIGDVSELIGGGTPSRKASEYFDGDIIWLTPTEIPKTSITVISESKEKITALGLKKSSAKLIPKGAVLLTTRASIGYAAIAGTTVTTNQGFASFDCSRAVLNYYLAYWLFYNKDLMESVAGGTTFKEISKTKLRNLVIPLPPLNEQKRIVAKIESIFGQIDAAVVKLGETATLTKMSKNLVALRSSVLKQAFDSKLVSQDANVRTWVNIGDLIKPSKERFDPQNSQNRVFLGLEHIESNSGKILAKGNSRDTKSTKTVFRRGDVLYGRLRPYLNKVCVANFDGVCSTDILVFPKQTNLSSQYLAYFLSTNAFVDFATRNSMGIHHPRIKFDVMSKFRIPLPSFNEQKLIVTKIESILAEINTKQQALEMLESQIRSIPDSIISIKNSVLKLAFEGKLVPQNLKDEPTSVLPKSRL